MFRNAMFTNDTQTENSMPAHSTTGDAVLNFFSKSGAMRGAQESTVLDAFSEAAVENPELALKALFYARDVRGGQGERRLFRTILRELALGESHAVVVNNLLQVVKYGRWDDLTVLEDTPVQDFAAALWVDAIIDGDRLAAKWAPRKGAWFGILRKMAGVTAPLWRKWLVSKTDVVESKMCAQEWPGINYSTVPSRASMIYRKAFSKHDPERYVKFIQDAKAGKVKIHSAALYPHELSSRARYAYDATIQAQWNQLPNFLDANETGILPISDVSGSMVGIPMDVSIGLGVYLAERNQGAFKDLLVTFSEHPVFIDLSTCRSLHDKICKVAEAQWDMNTNLEAVFRLMLQRATASKVPQGEMPSTLLILSDMQFDQCTKNRSDNAMDMIRREYTEAGYEMPEIVFWNLRASQGQPAKSTTKGVSLVSGFSPSIMKAILGKKPQATPTELMLDVLAKYEDVTL